MKRNGKLSAALHALVHLVKSDTGRMTSEEMAICLDTNPVVVRRTVAGLREAGIVASAKGHGGGITLARPPEAITVADVSAALGEPLLRIAAVAESSTCLIERSVVARLDRFRQEAERLLAARLAEVTLADIIADVGIQFAEHHRRKRHDS